MIHFLSRRLRSWRHHRVVDNHRVRILLPTLVVRFLIAEARGLVLGFLGAFGFQRVLFRVPHLYDFVPKLFLFGCVFVPELFPLRGVFLQSPFFFEAFLLQIPFFSLALKLLFLFELDELKSSQFLLC